MSVEKISVDYNKVTNVEVEDEYDTSTWEEIQTNDDQDLNTSTIAKIDDEIMVSLENLVRHEVFHMENNLSLDRIALSSF